MDLAKLITEGRNPETIEIDRLDTLKMLLKINAEDEKVPAAVAREIPNIAKVVDEAAARLKRGGRIIYIGAGTSGRLGVLDASECPPTFGVASDLIRGIIAGGPEALTHSAEGAEDQGELGAEDLKNIGLTATDVVIGIAASGRTPYVIYALNYAKSIGAYTAGISNNQDCRMREVVEVLIAPVVGAEVIMGSTRMKAGTAQKLVLNMISTGTMIKIGKVYSNLMVDLKASNEKLFERARRITMLATGTNPDLAEATLRLTDYRVKPAIVMLLTGLKEDEALKLLADSEDLVDRAIRKARIKNLEDN